MLYDPDAEEPLTPNHLLMVRNTPNLTPGVFTRTDMYAKKRWRHVQYLTEQFWNRWSREYLQTLQTRQKWSQKRRNLQVDDIVIVCETNLHRGQWCMGKNNRNVSRQK